MAVSDEGGGLKGWEGEYVKLEVGENLNFGQSKNGLIASGEFIPLPHHHCTKDSSAAFL